jgi:hypothetical protein
MNHFRLLAIGMLLIFALICPAQQTATAPAGVDKQEHGRAQDGVPTVEEHLNILTEKLDLTGDQQARIKPILQDLHDATLKFVGDKTLAADERLAKVRPLRYKADMKIREILNDVQKKRLDQFEQEPHPELHGGVQGKVSPPRPSQQN